MNHQPQVFDANRPDLAVARLQDILAGLVALTAEGEPLKLSVEFRGIKAEMAVGPSPDFTLAPSPPEPEDGYSTDPADQAPFGPGDEEFEEGPVALLSPRKGSGYREVVARAVLRLFDEANVRLTREQLHERFHKEPTLSPHLGALPKTLSEMVRIGMLSNCRDSLGRGYHPTPAGRRYAADPPPEKPHSKYSATCAEAVLRMLREAGQRRSARDLEESLHEDHCGSVVRHTLAEMVKAAKITSKPRGDVFGCGYGLPEWGQEEGRQPT